MLCFHWRDSLDDSRWYAKPLLVLPAPLFLLWGHRAKRRAPEAWRAASLAVQAQRLVERESAPSLDACAHPSAHALGLLLAGAGGVEPERHYRLGYLLGRWVYLADAADDYEKDARRRNFNPFLREVDEHQHKADGHQKSREALSATAAQLLEAWDATPVQRFRPILENILTRGLEAAETRIFEGKRKRKEGRKA
jgi:hypothetical protein